ncbi:MAG TPA: alpha/beta fold hydrolase [Actinophytocola sp.]|uniref:alpha/beta fold hydrolase n=1 Tax=Actinophytocola sp. TaxID=1872138 RepID=UPI002DDCC30D|nr:alpha/beta fold hydrolase [Actinophytocola sp.]HEV2779819.1 alpha/beta fold hydrolase [Actinophytocola sp.]
MTRGARGVHGEGERIDTPHGRVYLEVEGEGPVVVLVPGGPGVGHAHYHPWFSRLADRHTVVYFDAPGTGRSDRPTGSGDYSVRTYAGAVEAIREHLGAGRIAVAGLSFGGLVAAEYATTHPDRVRRLVFSNAPYSAASWQRGNIDNVNHEIRVRYPQLWDRLMRLREAGITSLAPEYQAVFQRVLPELEWADPDGHPTLNRDPAEKFQPDVYTAFIGSDPEWTVQGTLAGFDPTPRLAGLAVPTLVVTGRFDRVTPPAIAHSLARLVPGAELIVFERSGHRPWAEEPDRYFAALHTFLLSE